MSANRLLFDLLNLEAKLLDDLGECENLRFDCHNHVYFASFQILIDLVAVCENSAQPNPLSAFL